MPQGGGGVGVGSSAKDSLQARKDMVSKLRALNKLLFTQQYMPQHKPSWIPVPFWAGPAT